MYWAGFLELHLPLVSCSRNPSFESETTVGTLRYGHCSFPRGWVTLGILMVSVRNSKVLYSFFGGFQPLVTLFDVSYFRVLTVNRLIRWNYKRFATPTEATGGLRAKFGPPLAGEKRS